MKCKVTVDAFTKKENKKVTIEKVFEITKNSLATYLDQINTKLKQVLEQDFWSYTNVRIN